MLEKFQKVILENNQFCKKISLEQSCKQYIKIHFSKKTEFKKIYKNKVAKMFFLIKIIKQIKLANVIKNMTKLKKMVYVICICLGKTSKPLNFMIGGELLSL